MTIGQPADTLTASDVRAYGGDHLAYEFNMLRHAVQLGRQAKSDQAAVNVSVELFALHLRNLLEFFFWSKKRKRDTDVLAKDFCSPAAQWTAVQAAHPLIGTVLAGAQQRAHQEIAHLTTHRMPARPPAKHWDYDPILSALQPVVRQFLRVAARDRVDPRVPAAVAALFPPPPVVVTGPTVNLATDSPQSGNVVATTIWPCLLATGPARQSGNVPGSDAETSKPSETV